ncbi:hypothetical protein PFICI_08876 [Pestalotiopsis fici W106-1]|uniref:Uncharacterized protein n=1 Tax=Pestalotiopsis fici (strain W106-1 / CGMCC3.15140) TaxID=1229662 RepID=W3WYS0_PESFW|nr:uncharacterized protein PFICI_08876 [Pestalotiopsis fici W106-1]ETS79023.1 hypothetical protein PFICI_08876 [Pestalotiopsis fici W106-1]
MADPAKYWPGGIPAHIRCHGEPITERLDEECKGWQLFLEESAQAREPGNNDANFEVNQRRKLVDQWASFTQIERDAYQDRAPNRGKSSWYPPELRGDWKRELKQYGFCNLLVTQPLSGRNQALWAKIRIMMYRLDGSGEGPSIGDLNCDNGIYILKPNAAGPSPVQTRDFYKWAWVDNALFDRMAMTRQGTVIFHRWGPDKFFADQEALNTGLLLLCHFENNGEIAAEVRVSPLLTYEAHCKIYGLGHRLPEIIFDNGLLTDPQANAPLNMEKSILELVNSRMKHIELFEGDTSEDQIRRDIERYAPGYLDAEAQGNGMAADYDHNNFKSEDEL